MATTLRVYDRAGARLGALAWSSLSRTIVRNDLGQVTASVPLSQIPAGLLARPELYLRVAENGVEAPDWYLLDDDGDDAASDGGTVREVVIGGKGVAGVLDLAEVYPRDHKPGGTMLGLTPTHPFNTTPGAMLAELLRRAQARATRDGGGPISKVTWTFTDNADSAGRPWPSNFAKVFDAGTTLLKVLQGMAEDQWVDWEMRGMELRLYVPDTELAKDHPEVVLRLGQGVTQAPRKRTRAGVRSAILAVGNEGAVIEVTDPTALALYGRREGYDARGTITDVGTLTAATQVSLQRRTAASESFTLALEPASLPADFPGLPRPGGYIRYDQRRLSPTQLEPMRVQSIAWQYGDEPLVSVELADLWVDRDVRNERRIDAILNGSSANERVPLPPLGDEKPPSAVEGLALVSAPYEDPVSGTQGAQATATWLAVTTDVDGTPVGELRGYTLQWRQPEISSAVYQVDAGAGQTLASWAPVVPGTFLEARIAAYDRWENYSDWSEWVRIVAGVDETPPATPSTPTVSNWVGLLRALWDGEFLGSARPADLHYVEVHVSPLSNFTPDPRPLADGGTLAGTLYAPGYLYLDTPYEALRYVRLVGVDTTGNRSAASAEASGKSGQLLSDDIFDGAVGESKLADLTVTTAKIKELDLNSGRVGTLQVGKLEAGTMTANVIMGGRIATGDRGKGVAVTEMNSLGIFRWDAGNNLTVAIDNNGALITGTYRTALTGRRIEIGTSGDNGRVLFTSPNGNQQWVRSVSWGSEAIEALEMRGGTQSLFLGRSDNGTTTWGWKVGNIFRDTFTVIMGDSNLVDNQRNKLYIDRKGTTIYTHDGGTFYVYDGTGQATRFEVKNDRIDFRPGGSGEMNVLAGDNNNSSRLRFYNGQYYGAMLKFFTTGTDAQRVECRWAGDDGWMAHWAQGFVVQSDGRYKSDTAEVDGAELLADVRSTRVSSYRRRLPAPSKDAPRKIRQAAKSHGPLEVGLIAQDAPQRVRADGEGSDGSQAIDLYQMAAVTWGATGHLADLVEDQGRELRELRDTVAALTGGKR